MSKHKFNAEWMRRHLTDPFVKKAQQQNFRSRAAFKLMGLDEELKLIKAGMTIVDLGSAPGAWSQYAQRKLLANNPQDASQNHLKGRIIALDLLPMENIHHVDFFEGDFREMSTQQILINKLNGKKADLVMSDMAHNLTGIADVDAIRMADLIEMAIVFCKDHLNPNGSLICKAFHGSGFSQTKKLFKDHFMIVKEIKPEASRAESSEVFLFGRKQKI
jgi:23S rRNA (uridine2552-2'-O)-methyltransferase